MARTRLVFPLVGWFCIWATVAAQGQAIQQTTASPRRVESDFTIAAYGLRVGDWEVSPAWLAQATKKYGASGARLEVLSTTKALNVLAANFFDTANLVDGQFAVLVNFVDPKSITAERIPGVSRAVLFESPLFVATTLKDGLSVRPLDHPNETIQTFSFACKVAVRGTDVFVYTPDRRAIDHFVMQDSKLIKQAEHKLPENVLTKDPNSVVLVATSCALLLGKEPSSTQDDAVVLVYPYSTWEPEVRKGYLWPATAGDHGSDLCFVSNGDSMYMWSLADNGRVKSELKLRNVRQVIDVSPECTRILGMDTNGYDVEGKIGEDNSVSWSRLEDRTRKLGYVVAIPK